MAQLVDDLGSPSIGRSSYAGYRRPFTRPREAPPAARSRDTTAEPHLLVLRFVLFNVAASAVLVAAHLQGWVAKVFAADHTGITPAIVVVFLVGLGICAHRVWRVDREAARLRSARVGDGSWAGDYLGEVSGRDSGSRAITGSALKLRIGSWISSVRQFANSLVMLGLIGTVVGFIIALSGIKADSVSDLAAVSAMVTELLAGMSVALYTTLVGGILNLWLIANFHMLSSGATRLVLDIVALGESHARLDEL